MLSLVVAIAALAASPPPAAPKSKPIPTSRQPVATPAGPVVDDKGLTTKDFHIETDVTDANFKTGDFTMPHKVRFFRPGTDVTGDSAKGNINSSTVTIIGNVVMHDSGNARETTAVGAPGNGGPTTLMCDSLYVDSRAKLYICNGHLRYMQGTRSATADNGRLDQLRHMLDLTGSVHLQDGPNAMSGVTVHYDTLTRDVHATGTPMEIRAPLPRSAAPAPKKK